MDTSNSNVDIMSDSDCSESSARSNGNTSSSESSDSNNSEMSAIPLEPSRILKQNIELPVGLCENASIFEEFFSLDTWNTLPTPIQEHLTQFLPRFSDNPSVNAVEQTRTIHAIFNNEVQRFGSAPLSDFQRNLEGGNYRPDIARLRANMQKSQRREQRFQECERISRIAKAAMISREKLLKFAYDAPLGGSLRAPRMAITPNAVMPKLIASAAAQRSKKRYFHEISAIAEDIGLDGLLSEDENYPDGPPVQLTRKQRRHLGGFQGGPMSPGAESRVMSTMSTKGGILDHIVGPASMAPLTDDFYRQAIFQHKKRKLEDPDHPELITTDVNLQDILGRAQLSATLRRQLAQQAKQNSTLKKSVKIKTEPSSSSISTPTTPPAAPVPPISMSLQPIPLTIKQSPSPIIPSLTPPTMSLLRPIAQPSPKTIAPPQLTIPQTKLEPVAFKQQYNEPSQLMLDDSQHHYDPSSDDSDEEMEPASLPPPLPTPAIIKVETTSSPILISPFTPQTPEQKSQRKKQSASTPIKLVSQPNGGILLSQHANTTANRFSPIHPIKEEHVTVLHDSPTLTMKMEPINATSPSIKVQSGLIHMAQYGGTVKAATFSDLEGIDMMHLPVDLDDSGNMDLLNEIDVDDTSSIDIIDNRAPELMQETHVCFFSLVRDIFCSTPNHRTTMMNLQTKISAWLANPITALNDWYSSADNWLTLLDSGMQFLAGEFLDQPDEFVPYVEYKVQLHIYQWIGAGRDSDQHLNPLCEYWLLRRNEMGTSHAITVTSSESGRSKQNSCSGAEFDEGFITIGGSLSSNSSAERPCSPPPPRCPTTWTVVKASDIDVEEFRVQERRRFDSPHLSFTYRQHGFESVVGPVKGIYTQIPALTKARGHTMLTVDRPNFVTILTLVRDATARLPNGEGTRSDICELLRSSQYINPEAADNVLQTIVSGALDRMHTEHDPCVRYDPKRKIWIYLHRGRSEEEFEKMHQQFQGLSKHKKQSNRKIKHKLIKSPISMGAKPSNSVSPVTPKPVQPMTPKPVQPIQPVIVPAAPQPPAVLVPSSSSVVVSNSFVPAPVIVTQPEFQHPVVSVQQPALQFPPPQPQQQKQQPLPALSSIQNPSLVQLSSNQPPLLNKFTNIVTTTTTTTSSPAAIAKKSLIKAELVPIKQPLVQFQKIEHIDVEASLEAHTTPILIKPQQKQQLQQLQPQQRMPSLILDTKSIQKNKTNKILMPVVSSQASQPPQTTLTTPIEVSTPAGIQTVHVSIATTTSAPTSIGPHLIKTSSLPSMSVTSQQSILINQNRSQSPMYITSAANKKPTIKPPPLIAQSAGHSYMIPMTISNSPQHLQQQHKVLTPIPSTQPKLFKAVMPALTSTNAPKAATSLLQHHHTQPKQVARAVLPGKSLISPSVAAANLSLQQQKLISTSSIRPPGPQQHQKISLTTAKGQPTTLTPSQQRQILQNIFSQQQKVRPNTISLVPSTVVVSGSQQIHQPHLQTIQQPHLQTIQPQQQKTVIVAQQPPTIVHQKIIQTPAQSNLTTMAQLVPSSAITTSSGTVTTVAPATSLINRQIIQIHQTNAQPQPTGTTTGKVQTVSAASLTPQQQQNLLQSIKQQQIRVQNQQATATPQQQSLIMKQQQVLQQIQKQLQQQQLQQQQPGGVMKPGQSLLGINATVVSQVQTIQTTVNPTVTRIVKPQLVQQQQQQQQLQQQHQQPQLIQMSHGTVNNMVTTVTTVRTSAANVITTTSAPMMAKVLTNSTGQIISLENLLQKQGGGNTISGGTTLRVAGAKPGQTSLIQLAGAPGSQIAQYAVVSQGPQGRNLISLATPQRLITTQASTSTVSTTMSQLRKTGASNIVQQQQHQQQQHQQHQPPKLMQVSQTISGTGQQLVNAKVLGVQAPYRMKAPNTTTGVRMMNSSNLNIAHIAGKPVIIASKPVTSANGQPAQVQQQQQHIQQLPRQNVIWQSATPTGSVTGQQPTNFVIGGQTVKVQGNVLQHFDANQSGQIVSNNTQTVMFGNQMVKLQAAPNQMQHHQQQQQQQQQQHIVVSSAASGSVLTGSRTVVLGTSGQTIRVHPPAQNQVVTSGTVTMAQQQQQQMIVGKNIKNAVKGNQVVTSTGQQRVVLAVQGGGQILLPPGFQGGAINLKSLQGLKVIPIQQQNKGDATNDRQIFAQIISSPQAPRPPGGNS